MAGWLLLQIHTHTCTHTHVYKTDLIWAKKKKKKRNETTLGRLGRSYDQTMHSTEEIDDVPVSMTINAQIGKQQQKKKKDMYH